MEKIDHIPIQLGIEDVRAGLHLKNTKNIEQVRELLEIANSLFAAQAVYKVAYVDEKFEDGVTIDGTRFTSRVMRKNMDEVGRVFPYVITLGPGLEDRANGCEDLLQQYYLDAVGNIALRKSRKYLEDRLRSRYAIKGLSYMSPGSLEDWPIQEQPRLFSVLDGAADAVGVSLSDSLLMIPKKSVSGIYFPTEVTFFNCQLCPRENCQGRKARYSQKSAREYGVLELE
jgi:hypothetical protein